MGMIINPYVFGAAYDADAQAFFTAAGITDTTQKSAVNQLVLDLKSYSIWTKMKALYPFVGGTATTHKYNLKDPQDTDGAFRLVFNGGWTHSSTGAKPNGTNAYANTFFNPTSVLSSISSQHYSYYTPTDTGLDGRYDICGYSNFPNEICALQVRNSSTTTTAGIGSFSNLVSTSNTNFTGNFIVSRTNSTTQKIYRNSSLLNTSSTSTSTSANCYLFIAAVSASNSFGGNQSDREARFASFGDGLTDTEAGNLYTAIQAFQTTLSRNV